MFYVKENKGKYYIADDRWRKAYETGALSDSDPVARFLTVDDARLFVAIKNGQLAIESADRRFPCAPDCRYYGGHMNEEKCDYCLRKGNIYDYYLPEPRADHNHRK